MLVHGGSGSTKDWDLFGYTDVLKDDYQLIMVDLRGHGQSDKPHDAASYAPETQAGDIVAVLDELEIDKTHYFGFSLGGALGWALAKHEPDRFQSMIIDGDEPAPYDASGEVDWMKEVGAEGWAKAVDDIAEANDVWQPGIYEAYAGNDVEALAHAFVELSLVDATDILPEIDIPILLIQTTEDPELEAMTAASETLPDARLVLLEGLEHFQGFILTDRVLPHITEFLAEVNAESGIPGAELDSETVDKIESIVEQTMSENRVPGVAIGIVKDGEVVYAEGFGEANIESGNPVTSQSLFNVAHITNLFTATAIMQLVEQGKIDLDAPVTEYLPYFRLDDPRYTEITVRQLLDHTSGMPGVSIEPDAEWKRMGHDNPDNEDGALERLVRDLDEVTLLAAPGGDETLFSNIGIDVLGDIIAKVSGQSYEDYMEANIFEPLGMEHSTFILDDADASLLTTGYQLNAANTMLTEWGFFPFNMQHNPSIGLITNVDDINKWALAFLNGGELNGARILESDTLAEMWSPSSTMDWGGIFQDFGLGWPVSEADGHRLVWFVGDVPGQISNLILAPDDGAAVVAMTNSFRFMGDDELWYATDISTAVMYELLGLDYEGYWAD